MKISIHLFILPGLLLLTACSATQRVEEVSGEYKTYYAQLSDYKNLPTCRLRWQEALEKLEHNNLEYREQKRQYENSKFNLGKTVRSLIPMLDAGFYYNAPLRWNDDNPADSNFNINVIFNLPQLVYLPIERYTDALALIKADTDCRLKKRELEARLYQTFREYELLLREEKWEQEKNEENELTKKIAREAFEERKRLAWSKLCTLLNDFSAQWEPDCSGLPLIRLENYRQRFSAPDKLYLANLSLQAEAARLRKLGIFIRFMPTAQISFFSPSLFTASGGNQQGFMRNADDVRINLSSYITLDTRGELYHDYQDAKTGEKLTQELLKQNMREHREKIATVLRSWEKYEEWKLSAEEYIAFRNNHDITSFEEAKARHKESLEIEKSMIEQERANMERECAAMQEYGWRLPAPPAPSAMEEKS